MEAEITKAIGVSSPENLIRGNWQVEEAMELFALPFADLMYKAQTIHRMFFDPNEVQLSTLLSIKTGGCPEDCKYCPQSAKYDTGVKASKVMELEPVLEAARKAKAAGATRFCMGAAWRSPKERDMEKLCELVEGVKELGLETCVTAGMLTCGQASQLKESGLDYYNHNLDTSEEFYKEIITTRTYQDRLDTLENVRQAGLNVCCGGIVGMGEAVEDRASMLVTLANLPKHPESVPINMLVKVEGTPLAEVRGQGSGGRDVTNHSPDPRSLIPDPFSFIRTIAVARIMMPASHVRLSAGREEMSEETQALCFLAGANSIFYGDKLLTTSNPKANSDMELFAKLGIRAA